MEDTGRRKHVISMKLHRLKQLRVDSDMLFCRIEQQLVDEGSRLRSKANLVDAIGTISTVAVSLGALVQKGLVALNLTGPGLEAANKELAKDAFHIAFDPGRDIVAEEAGKSLGMHSGIRHYLGTALHVLANLTTPSYWAMLWTNRNQGKSFDQMANLSLDALLKESIDRVRQQHLQVIRRIDKEIIATERSR